MDSAFSLSGAAVFLSRCSAYPLTLCRLLLRRSPKSAGRGARRRTRSVLRQQRRSRCPLRAAKPPSKARRAPVGVFADLPREREKQHFPYGCGVAAEWERARGIESRKADVVKRPPAAVTSFLQVCRSYREACRDKSRGCSCRQARILCS